MTDQAAEPADTADSKDRANSANYRVEHDTMGEVLVPASALYGAQTARAVENFPISGRGLEAAQIRALARIKKAAAQANAELGVIDAETAEAIKWAAEQVIAGRHDDQFPVDVYQTGSGTSSNMNMNEVLARLASDRLASDRLATDRLATDRLASASPTGDPASNPARPTVHPNDHVNASQSSNDVFPTSVHLAAAEAAWRDLIPALDQLAEALAEKAREFSDVVKAGRTHLMDATPVTLGQEFSGYEAAVRHAAERVESALGRVAEVPLGGTAVGTGINTPLGFPERVIELLAEDSGLPITEARNHFEAQSARDALVELSGQLKTAAVSLIKICNDLRWMGSGPRAGLGEIRLPDLQPGSSIMPGKVNPVIPEAALQVCSRVIGNDAAITWGGASGFFELNVQVPLIGSALLESIRLLTAVTRLLAAKVVAGITADRDRCLELAESSPSIVTPLNRLIGYEAAAKVAKYSVAHQTTVRQAAIDLGLVHDGRITEAQLDQALAVMPMTRPH
ncbi:MAG: class II fumarate hydratase [Bifidobacteriaceae bacterium]|jgi:fumarate hydratase class II|nr:class II fumarate hydratase [Bifidobacteriaceae bacterium]